MSLISTIQKVYGGLTREAWLLAITQLINRSGAMVIFFLSLYLKEEMGLSVVRLGIIMACYGAGSFVGTYQGGRLTDKYGPITVMKWSLLLGGVLFVLIPLFQNFYLLCIGMFVLTTVGDAFRPANMAAVSFFSTPETYVRSMSLNRLAINLGFAVGPMLGAVIKTYSFVYIFWADGLTSFAAFLIIFFFLKTERKSRQKMDPGAVVARPAWRDTHYVFFLVLSVFYVMSFFQFFSLMPLYYTTVEKLTPLQYGFLMTLNGLIVATVELAMIYKIEKKTTPYNFIAIGSFLLVISYGMVYFFHGWLWMIVITIVISFSEMLAMPFMNAIMNKRSDHTNKGQYASFYVMAWSTGQTLLPLIATQMIDNFGYNALWLVMGFFALIITVGIKMLERSNV